MSDRIPLGEKEDHRREFKSALALKDPEIIARGVVAMLNAEGGEVWVGLREEGERAVAIEPILDAEREARRLQDSLVDTVEPSLLGEEVRVDSVPTEEGAILRVTARPQEGRKPYAFTKRGGWHFVVRVGGRTRPMAREEIKRWFSSAGAMRGQDLENAKKRILEGRERLRERGDEYLWVALEPAADLDLDLQDRTLQVLFEEPSLTRNRRAGFNFAMPYSQLPQRKSGRLVIWDEGGDRRVVEIKRNGGMTFGGPLASLFWKKGAGELWSLSLLEYPISAFRIASAVYGGKLQPEARIVADLALFGIEGLKLKVESPQNRWMPSGEPKIFEESKDLVVELAFSAEQIRQEPDRCGYRLVERVFEAFGYGREQIPEEFDQKTGRLVLPE
jgi:hypothetical protein